MRVAERRERIVALVADQGRVTVEALARMFEASQETIRRDLTALAEQHRVRKFHGGASQIESFTESAFSTRMAENAAAKRAIAARAAALFQPGDALFIDTGSTTLAFAAELGRLEGLTVITNAIGIAQLVSRRENRTFLLGGEHRHDAGENVGSLVVQQLAGFSPEHAVLTVGSLSADGLRDFDLQEAEIARAMIERCRHITILADSSKFQRMGLFHLCPLSRIHRLVTDAPPPEAIARALKAAGVEVLVAEGD